MSDAAATSPRLEMIEKVIAKGGADPFPFYARAMELRSLGRTADALAAFEDLAARTPAYVATYLMAAQAAAEAGLRDAARAWCDRGLVAARAAHDGKAEGEIASFRDGLGPA